MSQDKFYTDSVSDKISGDDDEKDLATTGKGLVTGRVKEDSERPTWLSSNKRYHCSNCRQGFHNTPENDKKCKRRGCEYRCQTHYIGRDGRARPYGVQDDSFSKEDDLKLNPKTDSLIDKLNKEWNELHPGAPKDEKKEVIL